MHMVHCVLCLYCKFLFILKILCSYSTCNTSVTLHRLVNLYLKHSLLSPLHLCNGAIYVFCHPKGISLFTIQTLSNFTNQSPMLSPFLEKLDCNIIHSCHISSYAWLSILPLFMKTLITQTLSIYMPLHSKHTTLSSNAFNNLNP